MVPVIHFFNPLNIMFKFTIGIKEKNNGSARWASKILYTSLSSGKVVLLTIGTDYLAEIKNGPLLPLESLHCLHQPAVS